MALATAAPTLVYEGLTEAAIGELQTIHEQEGCIRPDKVVEVATDPTNPLHEQFEWDNAAAGHQHRLAQARQVIRAVRVYVSDRPEVQVRAFVSIGMNSSREYRKVTEVLGSPITFEQLRRSVHADLIKLQRKLARFEEFAAVASVLQEVAEQLS